MKGREPKAVGDTKINKINHPMSQIASMVSDTFKDRIFEIFPVFPFFKKQWKHLPDSTNYILPGG